MVRSSEDLLLADDRPVREPALQVEAQRQVATVMDLSCVDPRYPDRTDVLVVDLACHRVATIRRHAFQS